MEKAGDVKQGRGADCANGNGRILTRDEKEGAIKRDTYLQADAEEHPCSWWM